ncbi:ABC transporter ATP-binding protein [Paludibaculum fermentans]|uniref:ABC transporter ATP-binding protein n=1 Tax=Paludibaculum fermentans TaxID=1473598 RepID=A0A7S7SNV9_PALFE|nr:ABC transporter ATP-binding protein [Paludibaculum fermentans]QOY90535.1 ABC transporter ATP-binding protein [Paludibaculum fermentans]
METNGENAVMCRGLKKVFGAGTAEVQALRGVDLDVRQGEVMMLVGPSGCGKTTLISTVAGVLDPSEGECLVFGRNLNALSDRKRTRYRGEHIGFVFQQFNLIGSLSLRENVAIPLLLNGAGYGEALRKADEALKKVELGDRTDARPASLSGGQQQRVAIARAIVHGPNLIVCDEPTSALDHITGQHVVELLRSVATGEGRALIIVTHDSRIYRYADRIAQMDDGRVQRVFNSHQEFLASERVQ